MQITDSMCDNYSEEADNCAAPLNKKECEKKEIEVTISVTLSKTVKIKVFDYDVIEVEDENGNLYKDIDYSNCDLKSAVESQMYLPQDAGSFLQNLDVAAAEAVVDDFSDWNVDEFEVILE